MEETDAFVTATFIMKSGRQLLKQLHHGGRHTCQFRPEQSDYTAHMARISTICGTDGFFHFWICCSNCLGWY